MEAESPLHGYMLVPRGAEHVGLVVQPRHGLSANLLCHARGAGKGSASFLAFVSGPHGISDPIDHYETILLEEKCAEIGQQQSQTKK